MTETVGDAVASETIAASTAEVWDALTNPEVVKKYFLGTNVTSTWREGEPITFSGEWDGKHYDDKGVILEIKPEKLLRITHYSPLSGKPDVPENYHTVEYRLEPKGKDTVLTITQGNNSGGEVEESTKTWQLVLSNMKELLEG